MPSGPVAPSGNTANNSALPRSQALAGAAHASTQRLAPRNASKVRLVEVFIASSPRDCPAATADFENDCGQPNPKGEGSIPDLSTELQDGTRKFMLTVVSVHRLLGPEQSPLP